MSKLTLWADAAFSMWTNVKTIRAYVETLKRCQRCCMGTVWRGDTDQGQRQLCRVLSSTSKPKWRLLFFGTDHFAVESLKLLTSCRCESHTSRLQACTGFSHCRVLHIMSHIIHTENYFFFCNIIAIVYNNIAMYYLFLLKLILINLLKLFPLQTQQSNLPEIVLLPNVLFNLKMYYEISSKYISTKCRQFY